MTRTQPPRWSQQTGLALSKLLSVTLGFFSGLEEIAKCHREIVPLDLGEIRAILKRNDPEEVRALAVEMMCICLQVQQGAVYQDGEICGNYIVQHAFYCREAR